MEIKYFRLEWPNFHSTFTAEDFDHPGFGERVYRNLARRLGHKIRNLNEPVAANLGAARSLVDTTMGELNRFYPVPITFESLTGDQAHPLARTRIHQVEWDPNPPWKVEFLDDRFEITRDLRYRFTHDSSPGKWCRFNETLHVFLREETFHVFEG